MITRYPPKVLLLWGVCLPLIALYALELPEPESGWARTLRYAVVATALFPAPFTLVFLALLDLYRPLAETLRWVTVLVMTFFLLGVSWSGSAMVALYSESLTNRAWRCLELRDNEKRRIEKDLPPNDALVQDLERCGTLDYIIFGGS